MTITRTFLDWRQPALVQAADWLIESYSMLDTVDLDRVVVVVPGRRAGRRLLELLVDRCDRAGRRLIPPEIDTVGRLPERLYESRKPFAADLVQKLAWQRVLQQTDAAQLESLVAVRPPDDSRDDWLALAELLARQHRELAAEGLDFEAVRQQASTRFGRDEAERWQTLAELQSRYLRLLDELQLWDRQTARLYAIEHGECETDRDLVLVAAVDLPKVMRQMLRQVSARVTCLIHAPAERARDFDAEGCLIPASWENVYPPLAADQVTVVDGPQQQVAQVVRTLAGYDAAWAVDEIAIGVGDESLIPTLQRALGESGVPARWAVELELNATGPCRFLARVREYLATDRFDALAALVRHPDVSGWIAEQPRPSTGQPWSDIWLTRLDAYADEFLPLHASELAGTTSHARSARDLQATVEQLLAPLRASARPLTAWSQRLRSVLRGLYAAVEWDRDDPQQRLTIQALEHIQSVLEEWTALPAGIEPHVPAADAIGLLLRELSGEELPPPPDDDALDLLGWLELPLDDAAALVVTGFNEGLIPQSATGDLFLPDGLRRQLGLMHNSRRYARDVYFLCVLLESRRELHVIAGRRDRRGDPLRPSRLLFATDADEVPGRVLKFFRDSPSLRLAPWAGQVTPLERSGLLIPRPEPLDEPVGSMSVTAFKTYLKCPYRFYLQHVLKLRTASDAAIELSAGQFGEMLHEVLRRFGAGPVRDVQDEVSIRDHLRATLSELCVERFGHRRRPAIALQIQMLATRLDAFAGWQARRAAEGWSIAFTEVDIQDHGVALDLPSGQKMLLRARVDRIDRHADGRWMVIDYKSGKLRRPDSVHRNQQAWVDLQLPLYQLLVPTLGGPTDAGLAYMHLPRKAADTRLAEADWSEKELAEARRVAVDVAQRVYAQEFWPPQELVNDRYDDFAAICQEGVFGKERFV